MSNRVKTWRVVDRGDVPDLAQTIEYECPACGNEAMLPVKGLAIAALSSGGVIFDDGDGALPTSIQCRKCRRVFVSTGAEHVR